MRLPDSRSVWAYRYPDGRDTCYRSYSSEHHPDGAIVDVLPDPPPPTELMNSTARVRDGRVLGVAVNHLKAPKAPALWYVLAGADEDPNGWAALIAFATAHFPAGAVIDNDVFAALPVRSEDQVAAVRWDPAAAIVHEVYVGPAWRRRRIGLAMIYAAAAAQRGLGGAPLKSLPIRTDLGEALVRSMGAEHRNPPRTHVAPPMTPSP